MKTPQQVRQYSGRYAVAYDTLNYDPYIVSARAGNVTALRKVTEWKNPGKGSPPTAMRLSANKEVPFQKLLKGLSRYLGSGGSVALRNDFPTTSPVYAIFWHHVLFSTPIFDQHTHRAFHYFTTGVILKGKLATIPRDGHWALYDRYVAWFRPCLHNLQVQDATITERQLDRALMQWGIAHQ